jgi:hypothetical protein
MSTSITTAVVPSAPPPPELPRVLLEQGRPQRDATTQAVLRYFEAERRAATGSAADAREHADSFDHLVAICYRCTKAMRNKKTGLREGRYFLRDRYGRIAVQGIPQFSNVNGRRTGYAVRDEGSALDVTRQWIQEWLLTFLAPYRGKSDRELIDAADAGKFRLLGLWCRLQLKQIVYRQHKRETKEQFTGFETATEHIGTSEMGTPSPLRAHAPFDQISEGVSNARRVVMANADELERLDLLTGLLAYLAVAEHVTEPHFEGMVTTAIAKMQGTSPSTARAYKKSTATR